MIRQPVGQAKGDNGDQTSKLRIVSYRIRADAAERGKKAQIKCALLLARAEKEIAPAHLQLPGGAVPCEEARTAIAGIDEIFNQERIVEVDRDRLAGHRSEGFIGEIALGDDPVTIAENLGKPAAFMAADMFGGQAEISRLLDGTR